MRVRDPAAAKWLLAPRGRSFLSYRPDEQRLFVPVALGLPRPYRRACTLASGLAPARRGRALAYDCITPDMARAIAVRLNQAKAEGLW